MIAFYCWAKENFKIELFIFLTSKIQFDAMKTELHFTEPYQLNMKTQ